MEQSELRKSLAKRKKMFENYLVEIRAGKKTANKQQNETRHMLNAK